MAVAGGLLLVAPACAPDDGAAADAGTETSTDGGSESGEESGTESDGAGDGDGDGDTGDTDTDGDETGGYDCEPFVRAPVTDRTLWTQTYDVGPGHINELAAHEGRLRSVGSRRLDEDTWQAFVQEFAVDGTVAFNWAEEPGTPGSRGKSVAGLPDGGFLVAGRQSGGDPHQGVLRRVDADGQTMWTIEDSPGFGRTWFERVRVAGDRAYVWGEYEFEYWDGEEMVTDYASAIYLTMLDDPDLDSFWDVDAWEHFSASPRMAAVPSGVRAVGFAGAEPSYLGVVVVGANSDWGQFDWEASPWEAGFGDIRALPGGGLAIAGGSTLPEGDLEWPGQVGQARMAVMGPSGDVEWDLVVDDCYASVYLNPVVLDDGRIAAIYRHHEDFYDEDESDLEFELHVYSAEGELELVEGVERPDEVTLFVGLESMGNGQLRLAATIPGPNQLDDPPADDFFITAFDVSP